MLSVLKTRWLQGYRTGKFPDEEPQLPDRFKGVPQADLSKGELPVDACCAACPTGAAFAENGALRIDLGKCIFCGKCCQACPSGALRMSQEYRMAAFAREELVIDPTRPWVPKIQPDRAFASLVGRSLKIREVSAGGCAACECDVNVLGTPAWDMGRFGIHFVASPRHADVLLVTGPVSCNMLLGLEKTYQAMPEPRAVIACGSCAISGGIYAEGAETCAGVGNVLPVDMYIPGCPPHPTTTLDALLRLMGRRASQS